MDEIAAGIDRYALDPHLVVEVRACALSRIADIRNYLPLAYRFPLLDMDRGEVRVKGSDPFPVI